MMGIWVYVQWSILRWRLPLVAERRRSGSLHCNRSRECRKSRNNFKEVNLFGQLFLSFLATLKLPFSSPVNLGTLLTC